MWSKLDNSVSVFEAQISQTGTNVPAGEIWAFFLAEI